MGKYKTRVTSKEGVHERYNVETGETVAIFIKFEVGPVNQKTGRRQQKEISRIPDPKHPKGERPFKNITEAEKYRRKLMNQVDEGVYDESTITVGEVMLYWYDNHVMKNLKPATQVNYGYVIDHFKTLPLWNIRIADLKVHHSDKIPAGVTGKAGLGRVRNYLTALSSALNFAARKEIIRYNPLTKKLQMPSYKPKKVKPPAIEEIVEHLQFLKDKSKGDFLMYRIFAIEHLDAFTGLRIGEVAALQWDDFDFTNRYVEIHKTAVPLPRQEEIIQATTKTEDVSKLKLSEEDVQLLKEYRIACAKYLLQFGLQLKNDHFVFFRIDKQGTPTPNKHMKTRTIRYYHEKTLEMIGQPNRPFKTGRHFHASHLLAEGFEMKVVQERLRHSTYITTANIYSHLLPPLEERAVETVTSSFKKAGYKI